jgi:mannan polymerase II complex ANP1 subunit
MAKRMDFSVVGLPHYTVWHLYEPSVDDIRHMEEMEQERIAREKEEKERAERMKKIKEDFNDPNSQWEKDKTDIEGITKKEEELQKQHEGDERGPISQPGKETEEDNKAKAEVKEVRDGKEDPKTEDVNAD